MNIGIVIANNTIGGSQRVAMNLSDWLTNKGIETTIISLKRTDKTGYDMQNYSFVQIESKRIIHSLKKIIKNKNVDCLISMGVPISVYTVPACFGIKITHIISERNDPSHFSGKKITKHLSRFLMSFCDGFVFQTNQAKEFYKKIVKSKPSVVIYNPLPSTFSSNFLTPFSKERKKTIVSVGRLIPQKNHAILIDTFYNLSEDFCEYNLIIFGEGSERNSLETKIRELKLDGRVYLPGESNAVFENIYDSSLFVLSSNYEGLPNSLIEAMALGLPCISTDCPCGGPRELIQNGKNGLLVPVNEPVELEKAVRLLLSDSKKRQMIGNEAAKIKNLLNSDIISSQWFDFIQKVYSFRKTK